MKKILLPLILCKLKKKAKASQNYFTLLKAALNILKNDKTKKASIKTKGFEAAWDEGCLRKILEIKVSFCSAIKIAIFPFEIFFIKENKNKKSIMTA